MASIVITSFFTKNGIPQINLIPSIRIWEVNGVGHLIPSIRIWEVNGVGQILIIGSPNGTGDPGTGVGTDGIMQEVLDGGSPPGGSPGGSQDGFYKFEFTDTMGYDVTKTYLVRTNGGSTIPGGERYQSIQIDSSINLVQLDVTEILKYDKNRTFIDKNNFTLTVFDDDGTTPLKVFDLKDDNGVASITSIFERIPQ